MYAVDMLAKVKFTKGREEKFFQVIQELQILWLCYFGTVHVLAEQQQVTGCILKGLCCLEYNKLLNRMALGSHGMSGKAHNSTETADSLQLTDPLHDALQRVAL